MGEANKKKIREYKMQIVDLQAELAEKNRTIERHLISGEKRRTADAKEIDRLKEALIKIIY